MPAPSARDVIVAALATYLPPTDRPDVEDRADIVVGALIQHGHLPAPDPGPTRRADMEELAQWLAERSQFARYTVEAGDSTPPGWHRIMASSADVNVAAAKALAVAPTDDSRDEIARAKWLLLRWHQEHSLPTTTAPSDT